MPTPRPTILPRIGAKVGISTTADGAGGAGTGAGIATTAKHFPGLGRVLGNTDNVAEVVDTVTTPTDPFLGSFQGAIDAGVPFVMVALATYTQIDADHLAVFSPTVMRLLRDTMGFDGVIVSDDLGAATAARTSSALTPARAASDRLPVGGRRSDRVEDRRCDRGHGRCRGRAGIDQRVVRRACRRCCAPRPGGEGRLGAAPLLHPLTGLMCVAACSGAR